MKESSKFPELSSRYKASTVRTLLSWLAEKTRAISNLHPGMGRFDGIAVAFWSLQRFLYILDSEGLYLEEATARDACEAVQVFLTAYQRLAEQSVAAGDLLWKITPKCHYMVHLSADMLRSRLNPRLTGSCWADESFLGKVKLIAGKCHSSQMCKRALQRYLLYLGIRWRRLKREAGNAPSDSDD
jgi:hypothetical protein